MYTNESPTSNPSLENLTRFQICGDLEDPFDEPLLFSDPELPDKAIAAEHSSIIIEDVNFTFLKPP